MKSQLSEISFITAFSYELVTLYDFYTLGAPIFPSLRKDKVFTPGDDVRGTLFFIQFKASEYIIGPGASLKDYWGLPFYRYQVQPKNKNGLHKLMWSLEQEQHAALYVSPAFHRKGELFDLLRQQAVIRRSTFWSPADMGDLTRAHRNTVSFKSDLPYGLLEPASRRIDTLTREASFADVLRTKARAGLPVPCDETTIRRTGDRLLELYAASASSRSEKRLVADIYQSRETVTAGDYLSLVATLLYECFVYVYPER